jgi:hypothetical protein
MDRSHTFGDQVSPALAVLRQGPDRAHRRISLAIALAVAGVLAIAPIVVMALLPDEAQATDRPMADSAPSAVPDAALVALTGRVVDLDGAIMQFRQNGNWINLNLRAADEGQRVFVQTANGELFEIAVSPGQTNVSAELPAHFNASHTLTFRVD